MKKYFSILLLSFAIVSSSCAQKTTIKGTLTYPNNDAEILVSLVKLNATGDNVTTLDSLRIKGSNKFAFNVDVKNAGFYYLQVQPQNANPLFTQIALYPKQSIEVELEYNAQKGQLEYKKAKGSKDIELAMQVSNLASNISAEIQTLQQRYASATSEEEKKVIESEFSTTITNYQNSVKDIISANKSLLISGGLLTFLNFEENVDFYKEIVMFLDEKYTNAIEIKQLRGQINQLLSGAREGRPAPEIELPDVHDNIRKLSSLRGKYVLIDFWASWCGPCRRENPNVVALYNKYKADGFDIFSVSLDKDKQSWIRAISQDNLIWENHVSDLKQWSSEVLPLYGFNSIPFTVLIDKEGVVLAKGLRGQELEAKLKEIFGK